MTLFIGVSGAVFGIILSHEIHSLLADSLVGDHGDGFVWLRLGGPEAGACG